MLLNERLRRDQRPTKETAAVSPAASRRTAMTMPTISKDLELHDQVVNLIAQRWATVTNCKVTIITASVNDRWLHQGRKYPDIVGWQCHPDRDTVEWIAE